MVNVVFDKQIEQVFKQISGCLFRKSLNIDKADLADISEVQVFGDKCLGEDIKSAILRPIDYLFRQSEGFCNLDLLDEEQDLTVNNELESLMFQELILRCYTQRLLR